MDKIFTLKNYKIASLVFAFLFLFLSVFKVNDITKLSIEALESPNYLGLGIGAILLVISVMIYLEVGIDIFGLNRIKLESDGEDILVKVGRSEIRTRFGKIEQIELTDECLVVLPANEYFDDDCIRDTRSSLGAFIDKNFKNRVSEFQEVVQKELRNGTFQITQQIQKEGESPKKSYGIGATALLKKPLESTISTLLVAITEQRAKIGLYSNISFVYRAVNEIYAKAVDNRFRSIVIPLLGSGHGGLNKRVAYLALVSSFAELFKKDGGSKIKKVSIVIYTKDKDPEIPKKTIRKILKFGVGLATSKE